MAGLRGTAICWLEVAVKNQPIPNDFLHCRCHVGPPEDTDSVFVRGDDIDVTVYPDCPFHAQQVRLAGNGVQFTLAKMEMPDGEAKAVLMAVESGPC
jgi:hypothetical protein